MSTPINATAPITATSLVTSEIPLEVVGIIVVPIIGLIALFLGLRLTFLSKGIEDADDSAEAWITDIKAELEGEVSKKGAADTSSIIKIVKRLSAVEEIQRKLDSMQQRIQRAIILDVISIGMLILGIVVAAITKDFITIFLTFYIVSFAPLMAIFGFIRTSTRFLDLKRTTKKRIEENLNIVE